MGVQAYSVDGTERFFGSRYVFVGSHSPLRRWLAFRFCEVTNRECEFVALTSDTSEADLKAGEN